MKIEVGKFYRSRNGDKVEILMLSFRSGRSCYESHRWQYAPDGRCCFQGDVYRGRMPECDLIEEWTDGKRFQDFTDVKPGDKFRCVKGFGAVFAEGETYTVNGEGRLVANDGIGQLSTASLFVRVTEPTHYPTHHGAKAKRFHDFDDVKPGDKLLCVKGFGAVFTSGETYTVNGDGRLGTNDGTSMLSTCSLFVRVTEPAVYGDWQVAPEADVRKMFEAGTDLVERSLGDGMAAYKVRVTPKRETVTLNGCSTNFGWAFSSRNIDGDTHRITFDTIDGKPDCASIRMEAL